MGKHKAISSSKSSDNPHRKASDIKHKCVGHLIGMELDGMRGRTMGCGIGCQGMGSLRRSIVEGLGSTPHTNTNTTTHHFI